MDFFKYSDACTQKQKTFNTSGGNIMYAVDCRIDIVENL